MRTRKPKSAVVCTIEANGDVWKLLDEIAALGEAVEQHTIVASKYREVSEPTRKAAEAAAGELTIELLERTLLLGAGWRQATAAAGVRRDMVIAC